MKPRRETTSEPKDGKRPANNPNSHSPRYDQQDFNKLQNEILANKRPATAKRGVGEQAHNHRQDAPDPNKDIDEMSQFSGLSSRVATITNEE